MKDNKRFFGLQTMDIKEYTILFLNILLLRKNTSFAFLPFMLLTWLLILVLVNSFNVLLNTYKVAY